MIGELIEAVHPEYNTWRLATLKAARVTRDGQMIYDVEWYDDFLQHSTPNETTEVSEIRAD